MIILLEFAMLVGGQLFAGWYIKETKSASQH
jgi:hypothetical protein